MARGPAVALAAASLILASCGISPRPAGGEAARPPETILADGARALLGASSYRVTGMIDPGIGVDLVVVPRGTRGTVSTHGVTFSEISYDGAIWIRGARLWQMTLSPSTAASLRDAWVKVGDPTAAFGLAGRLSKANLSIPGVIFGPRLGLQKSETMVGGRRVIELRNSKEIYDILADGIPYPVRWLETEIPGPDGQPCGIRVGEFSAPAAITPPTTSLSLDPPPTPA